MVIGQGIVELHAFRLKGEKLEFLLLKRSEKEIYPLLWQMISGRIENNEKAYEAALRELKEETGLTPDKLWVTPQINSFYNPVSDETCIIPVFAALIATKAEIIISDEHMEWAWVSPKKARKMLAWPGQRQAATIIADYFTNEKSLLKFVEIPIL